ncbi:dentin sialophosphoproteinsialophosphoprotein-like isoform X2 [Octopus vulgaris]|uniref:Dentin sialophosphoproteinsialophosphoprotein-like isoform X2 n=1 Tax=Octopus vulgaris TaxID=6645 RepID=A0AA36BEY7_OCTVU|nr:dentin sialophosphoproteinsialophosphoprotein-like isoform X2 [Octopus vulgaris]
MSLPVHTVEDMSVPVHTGEDMSLLVHTVEDMSLPVHTVEDMSLPVHTVEDMSVPVHTMEDMSVPVHTVENMAEEPRISSLKPETLTKETRDFLKEVTAELQECVPAVVLIQELESCISTDIKDQIELEYEIKGNEAAVNSLLHHLASSEHWQLRLAEALLSSSINLPDLAEKVKRSQEDLVSKNYHFSNEYSCGKNNNNYYKNTYKSLQNEVSRQWSIPDESKWESILPNLLGPLKRLDQEYPESWRLLALHLGYSLEEVSQLEDISLKTDSGSSLVNLIYNWLTHTKSDIDTLLIALGKMQDAQEVLNNTHVSEHMPYSVPFVEGNNMEPLVGDGQKLNSAPGLLPNSKFQNIQHEAGKDSALDAKHTLDSNKTINTASLDADNNNDLEEHRFMSNAVFLDTDAKNVSHYNDAASNHSSSGGDSDSKYEQKPEAVSEELFGEDLSQVSKDTEYESKILQRNEATLNIPNFNQVPENWSVRDDLQSDRNLVSPTLTPLLPQSSVISSMVTPDYSTSPSYSKESLPSSSSSSSSTKQETPEMSNFYSNSSSSDTSLSSPFFAKDSVSGSKSSSSLPQTGSTSPFAYSNTQKPKEAEELNETDTINQNSVLLESKLSSSNDVLEDSDKTITPDAENVAKTISEIPSESVKPSVETTSTPDHHIEDNSDVKAEILEPTVPESGFQNIASDASSDSEVNVVKTGGSFELSKGDSVAAFQSQMSGDTARDHSEKTSPKDGFQDEISLETKTTVPEETQHKKVLSETSHDRETPTLVAQKILPEEASALDSGFESKCEAEVMDSANTVDVFEADSQDILDKSLSKSEESLIKDEHGSHIEKSASEIVDSAIEAAIQIKAEQENKEKEEPASKIDFKRHFTPQNISYFVLGAAILSTTLILLNKFWK